MFAQAPQVMSPREALNIVSAGCAQAPANKETHILMERALKALETALFPVSPQAPVVTEGRPKKKD